MIVRSVLVRTRSGTPIWEGPHLATPQRSDAGFETCATEVYSAFLEADIVADVVHGAVRFQRVQAICVPDASGHPFQLLQVKRVRQGPRGFNRWDTPHGS